MAVTHTTAIRNALADLVADAHDVGSGTSVIEFRDATTVIVSFDLAATAFGAASSGIVTLASVPISAAAEASGEVDNFITRDQDGTQILAGSITAVGMGGDIEVTNINIADEQDCELESLTYESPD